MNTTPGRIDDKVTLREYRVTWEIDLKATSPLGAARQALVIQRDPDSLATVFEVTDGQTAICTRVDLSDDESICRTPGCTEDAANGEGFDGYCGTCADRREDWGSIGEPS